MSQPRSAQHGGTGWGPGCHGGRVGSTLGTAQHHTRDTGVWALPWHRLGKPRGKPVPRRCSFLRPHAWIRPLSPAALPVRRPAIPPPGPRRRRRLRAATAGARGRRRSTGCVRGARLWRGRLRIRLCTQAGMCWRRSRGKPECKYFIVNQEKKRQKKKKKGGKSVTTETDLHGGG